MHVSLSRKLALRLEAVALYLKVKPSHLVI